MNQKELDNIRGWLIANIFRNETIMYNDNIRDYDIDLCDIIASLYNLLHKEVNGTDYNYMFHWANKIGAYIEEHYFDSIMKGNDTENGEKED